VWSGSQRERMVLVLATLETGNADPLTRLVVETRRLLHLQIRHVCAHNSTIVDSRFRPHDDCVLWSLSLSKTAVEIDALVSAVTAVLSPLRNAHDSPYRPLCENLTSSTKPEVHNVSQSRERRTEPRSQSMDAQNLVKFGVKVSEICECTDGLKQTRRHTHHSNSE